MNFGRTSRSERRKRDDREIWSTHNGCWYRYIGVSEDTAERGHLRAAIAMQQNLESDRCTERFRAMARERDQGERGGDLGTVDQPDPIGT